MNAEKDLFYIQNVGFVGNCLKWWRTGGSGYTVDLNEAWKVTKEQADHICSSRPKEDFPWKCADVKLYAQSHLTEGGLRKLKEGK